MRNIALFIVASIFFAISSSIAKPVASSHPIVGTWRATVNLPGGHCDEIYSIRSDGTTRVSSAEELGESDYEISNEPDENGFYKWVDTVVNFPV